MRADGDTFMANKYPIESEHQERQRAIAWALRLHIGAVNLQGARTQVFKVLPYELLTSLEARKLQAIAAQVEALQKDMIELLRQLSNASAAYTAAHPTPGTARNPDSKNRRRGDTK